MPSPILIPAAVRALTISVIASGGLATGSGLAAALALGAVAATMGTRFMATDGAPIHDNVKQQIVANSERDTVRVFRRFHNTARVVRTSISERIVEICEAEGATFDDIAGLASGHRGRQNVLAEGDMKGGMWWAGQTQGLIESVGSVQQVIEEIIADAEEVIGRLPSLVS